MKRAIRRFAALVGLTAILAAASIPSIAQNTYTLPLALPLILPAGYAGLESFIRITNESDRAGTVRITATDDAGNKSDPVSLSLGANRAVNFTSRDLEQGNASKGLSTGIGNGEGNWRLELSTALEIRPFAYIRTTDGFVTSMYDTITVSEQESARIPFFNPGSNERQISRLRIINPGTSPAEIEITGRDDAGDTAPGGTVRLTLAAGQSRTLTAQALESGEGLEGRLGAGAGKWRLTVSPNATIVVMNLLRSPTGHLANLTPVPSVYESGLPLVLPADDSGREGFIRFDNLSSESGNVRITGADDTGRWIDPVELSIAAGAAVNLNSRDLEQGNAAKGLPVGIGDGRGAWRLGISTDSDSDLDVKAYSYIRTADGFVTAVTGGSPSYNLGFFNPGSNTRQVSRLRLIARDSYYGAPGITIRGRDDAGSAGSTFDDLASISVSIPSGSFAGRRSSPVRTLTAQEIEGSLGGGAGKWRLYLRDGWTRIHRVVLVGGFYVQNLLSTPTGHLADLSSEPDVHGNTPTTATTIEVPSSTVGSLETRGDLDYFCFNAQREVLKVWITGAWNSTVRTLIKDNTIIRKRDNAGSTVANTIYAVNTEAGSRWCVEVSNPESTDYDYTLHVEEHSATNVNITVADYVHSDTVNNNYTQPVARSSFQSEDEEHYYCFDVPRVGLLYLSTRHHARDGSDLDIGGTLIGFHGNFPDQSQYSRLKGGYRRFQDIVSNARAGSRWCVIVRATRVVRNRFNGVVSDYTLRVSNRPATAVVGVPSSTVGVASGAYYSRWIAIWRDPEEGIAWYETRGLYCFRHPGGGDFGIWTTNSAPPRSLDDPSGNRAIFGTLYGPSGYLRRGGDGPGNSFGLALSERIQEGSFMCIDVYLALSRVYEQTLTVPYTLHIQRTRAASLPATSLNDSIPE